MIALPREPLETAEIKAREVGRLIKSAMPEGWGFCLVLSSYGDGGFCTYVSSVEREGAVKMLRELLDKIERNDKEA